MVAEKARLIKLAARVRACGFGVENTGTILRISRPCPEWDRRTGCIYYLGINAPAGKRALTREIEGAFAAIYRIKEAAS